MSDTPHTNGHAPRVDSRRHLAQSETRRLFERYARYDDDWSCADLYRETRTSYFDVPGSRPSDRGGGKNWPIWSTESDLDRIRQKARIVCETNPYAIGLLENLITHIVGKGFKYKFLSKENTTDSDPDKAGRAAAVKQLIAKAQDEWDRFQRRNRWSGAVGPHTPLGQTREQEILRRLFRDGEALPRYYVRDGQLVVRFIEPEQLRNPMGAAYADGWSFGVKCAPEDAESVEAYHVVWIDPTLVSLTSNADAHGEEIDHAEMDHLKGPRTDSTIRRGVSMFAFGVAAALERARVLARNTSIAAAAKAAIAETWAHETGTASEVSTFRSGLADHTETRVQGDGGTTEDNVDVRYPGMIRDVPKGMTPVFPAPDNSAVYIQVLQADLRAACAAFAAPEYFTADATGGTYAGLKEASAPFVKFAESYQTYLGAAFARVVWRVIELAVNEGRLPREALTVLDLQVEGPTVYQRDRLQVAQESQIYNMLGVWSPQTIAMETGKDYEVEAANIEQHRERFGDMGTPLPMPGADGQMPGMPGLTPGGGDDAGGALHEGRDGQPARPFSEALVEAAGTCGVGQNPERDGCVKATAGGGAVGDKPAADSELTRLRSDAETMDRYASYYRDEHQKLVAAGKGDTPEAGKALDQATRSEQARERAQNVLQQRLDHEAALASPRQYESVEQRWQAQGISVSPEYSKKVVPQLEKSWAENAGKLRVAKDAHELLDDGKTSEQVWREVAAIGDPRSNTGLAWDHVFDGADRMYDRLSRAAERTLSRLDPTAENDSLWRGWEDATQEWFDHKMMGRVRELKPEIMAALTARRKRATESVLEAAGTCKQGETAKATGCVPASGDAPAEKPSGGESGGRATAASESASLPKTEKEAGRAMADALASTRPEVASDPALREKVAKNWAKELKGKVVSSGPDHEALKQGLSANAQSKEFADIQAVHGPQAVVLLKGEGNNRRAESVGASALVYSHSIEPIRHVNEAPAPGAATSEEHGGIASVLRHEYAHRVLERMPKAARESWESGTRGLYPNAEDVKKELTVYAGKAAGKSTSREEVFTEAFAIGTSPKYDPSRFSERARKLIAMTLQASKAAPTKESTLEAACASCGPDCDCEHCRAKQGQPLLETEGVLDVPDSRQSESWSCGAAVATAIAQFFGVEPNTEPEAVLALGSSPRDGTDPEHLVSVLQGAGLETTALAGMDLDDVQYYLSKGRPIVVAMQAWGTPEEVERLESGHYCIVLGADADNIVVMDPARFAPDELAGYGTSAGGQRVAIPRAEFLRRWRDSDAEGNVYERYGIAVRKADARPAA